MAKRKKKFCCNCIHRIMNVSDATHALNNPRQWCCKKDFWQDMSVCLQCNPNNRDWAIHCTRFKLEK